jgi:hypothetical protein
MSERFGSYPPDEPVIGASYPPAPTMIGELDEEWAAESDVEEWEAEEYDPEYDYDADEYYRDYPDESPTRQPLFYVLLGLVVVIGGLFVFVLYSLFAGGDGGGGGAPGFQVRIDSPLSGARVEIGKDQVFVVSASSTEPIQRFELVRDNRVVDKVDAGAPNSAGVYTAELRTQFDRKGEFKVSVRVTSASGGTTESAALTLVVIEPVGSRPTSIKGRVVALVNLRSGPGEEYEVKGQLEPNREVNILGKTANGEWLLIDVEGQSWVKRAAIMELDSLEFVPVRNPTATPRAGSPTPTGSATPNGTPNPNAVDLQPVGAILIDGGAMLRVTVGNTSTNNFEGYVSVSVTGGRTGERGQQLKINAGGAATVDISMEPPVSSQISVKVTIDPENKLPEANKDNNSATFQVKPTAEPPVIVILGAVMQDGQVVVSVRNNGGPLAATTVTVRASIGGSSTQQSKDIAMTSDNPPVPFTLVKPGTGAGTIEVLVGGVVADELSFTFE